MKKPPKTRVVEIDCLRVFAIAAVVVMHSTDAAFTVGSPSGTDRYLLLWLNQAARFAIPLFLFISGFALAYSNRDIRWDGYGGFIARRLKSIIPAYVLWSVVLMLYFGKELSVSGVVETLLLGRADFQMYFIPLIVQFYALFPVFLYLARPGTRWPLAAIIFLINLAMVIAYGYFGMGGSLRAWSFSWVFFFYAGCIFGRGEYSIFSGTPRATLILGLVTLAGATMIFLRSYQKVYSLGLPYASAATALKTSTFLYSCIAISFFVLLSRTLTGRVTGAVKVLLADVGNASFEIFLVHTLIMRSLIGLKVFEVTTFAGSLLIASCCLVIGYIGLNLLSLVPFFPSRLNLKALLKSLFA